MEATWLEGRVRQEFGKLREFLRVEEQAILDAVAEEARQKQRLAEEKMKRLAEDTEALAHEIERLQVEMKEDDVSFLMVRGLLSGIRCFRASGEPEAGGPARPSLCPHSVGVLRGSSLFVWRPGCFSSEQSSRGPLHFSLPLSPFLLPPPSLVLTLALSLFVSSLSAP